jgi:excisionase family DNA binding protein
VKPVLTVFEASKICRVSPKTITNWIEAGHIPAYKTVGGHRRIKPLDLAAFMKKQGIPIPAPLEQHGRRRILIVDDDPIIVETIIQALKGDERNYTISSASDGFEAGLKVKEFKPHLMILDIRMPGLRGEAVCRQIKSHPDTRDIRILVLSADLDGETHERMSVSGADVCFSKPLQLPRLRQEVAALFELE